MINLKTSTFLNLHTIMHPSPLNGHNQQWTVLICPPESLLTDRTRPRQDCFQPGRWDPRVWSKQVTNSKDKEGRGGEGTISFDFLKKIYIGHYGFYGLYGVILLPLVLQLSLWSISLGAHRTLPSRPQPRGQHSLLAGKMLIVTKWPSDIIRQTDGVVCRISFITTNF